MESLYISIRLILNPNFFSKILTWKKVVNYERLFPILIFEGRRNLDLLLYGDFVEKGK